MPSYECSICLEYFNATDNVPTSFPCGHSCCLKHTAEMMLCHVCRAKLPDKLTPNISLRDLAVDYVEIMERLRKLEAPSLVAEPAALIGPCSDERDESAAPAEASAILGVPQLAPVTSVELTDLAAPIFTDIAQINAPEDASDPVPSAGKKGRRKKKKGSTLSALFFRLLPVHLQALVLEGWVDNNHRIMMVVLSRLDVACSSNLCRQSWLILLGTVAVPRVRKLSRDDCVGTTCCFLKWLHSRQVKATSVFISSPLRDWTEDMSVRTFLLPGIVEVVMTVSSKAHIRDMLRICPNIVLIECRPTEFDDSDESIWTILSSFPHLKIKFLIISEKPRNEQEVCAVLETFGQSLHTLVLGSACLFKNVKAIKRVLSAIGAHPSITMLEMSVGGYPMSLLLNSFKAFGVLNLHDFVGTEADLISYIQHSMCRYGTFEVHSSPPNSIDFALNVFAGTWNKEMVDFHHGRKLIIEKHQHEECGDLGRLKLTLDRASTISESVAQHFGRCFKSVSIGLHLIINRDNGEALIEVGNMLTGARVQSLKVEYCSDCVITEEQMLWIPFNQLQYLSTFSVKHIGQGEDRFEGVSKASVQKLNPRARASMLGVESLKRKDT